MKKALTNSLKALFFAPVLALGVSAFVPTVAPVGAIGIQSGADSAKGDDQTDCLVDESGATCSDEPIFKTITNVLLFLIGAISVIMLIIGGIRYTLSGGDSGAVTSAKNTILYAVIGIIVALLAYAIVNFVLGSFVTS
ncbi:MAG: pilin [Candidatus Saccharimonadales bacterium]